MSRTAQADLDDLDAIKARERAKGVRGKVAWIDSFFEFLSDSFRPILGALLGASFFITFMALMATLNVIPDWNAPGVTLDPSWAFINLMWQSRLRLPAAHGRLQRVEEDRRRPVGGLRDHGGAHAAGIRGSGSEPTEQIVFGSHGRSSSRSSASR